MRDFKFSKSFPLPKWRTVRCRVLGHDWGKPVRTPHGNTQTCRKCKAERFKEARDV